MWKLLKIFGRILKAIFWFALLLACCVVILLYVLENGLPASAVKKISDRLSNEDIIVKVGRITFTPGDGLHLYDVSAVPRKLASESFGSVENIIVGISLSPFTAHKYRINSITLSNVDMPRHPRRIFRKLAKLEKEKKPKKPRRKLPDIPPIKLIVEDSNIIGMRVAKATAMATFEEPRITFRDISLTWPDTSRIMQMKGEMWLDLEKELLGGSVKGEAFPENLIDFLAEMGARTVIREINRFSEITDPIKAGCDFDVDLKTSDFTVDVDLDVKSCAYRGVPLNYAGGTIKAYGTNRTTWVDLKGLKTANKSGKLEGNLFYDEDYDSIKVKADSTMDIHQVFTIIDILNDGELRQIKPVRPPIVTADGVVAISTNSTIRNDLTGKITMGPGSIFSLKLKELSSDYSVKGRHVFINKAEGITPSGGSVNGDADFTIPVDKDTPPRIDTQVSFEKVDLIDLMRVLSITNSRIGECSGNLELTASLGTNQLHTLNGQGDFRIKNGKINRLRLFAGLTDYLSRNIPGVSNIVDQPDCSLKFSIKNGILTTQDFTIEGDVFSVDLKGSYDIPNDNLDFRVHVALFRKKSIAGRVSRIFTFPFKKLLLEFKLYGPLENPNWSYVNILEKITDQIPEKKRK